uniref:Uncharacterized protein n=1 Tax=viral metagenome TaxID=1070528 RepID=A0A6C0JY07_9ZZZZ
MRINFFLFLVFVAVCTCDTFTHTVEPGNTVNQDSVVSILPNGNVVEGFNRPGMSKLSTDIGYTHSCLLDRANSKVVLVTDKGDLLIVQNNAPGVRPSEGTPFKVQAIDRGVLQLECLTSNTFAILSAVRTDDDDLPFFRLYTVSGLDVLAESTDYQSPIVMKEGSGDPYYFIAKQGTSGLLLIGSGEVHYKADRPAEVVHWSLNTLAVPPTAVQDALLLNHLDLGIQKTQRTRVLDSSRILLGMWYPNQESFSLTVLQWTGSALLAGTTLVDPVWTDFVDLKTMVGLPLYDDSVVVIVAGDDTYSSFLISGLTITVQTANEPVFPTLPPFQSASVNVELQDHMDIDGSDVVYTNEDLTTRGTMNAGPPYNIVWGTSSINRASTGRAVYLLDSGVYATGGSTSISYSLTPTSLVEYMYEGPVPAGVARSTVGGGGSVIVTTSGTHPFSSPLVPGLQYYANPDGTITAIPNECCTIQSASPRLIGVAQTTGDLFVNWPNWESRIQR